MLESRKLKAQREEIDAWKEKLSSESISIDALKIIVSGSDGNNNTDRQQAAMELLSDKFKILLHALAEKGQLDWGDRDILTTINILQNQVHLEPNDNLLKQKIKTALGEIYNFDEFINLEKINKAASARNKISNMTK